MFEADIACRACARRFEAPPDAAPGAAVPCPHCGAQCTIGAEEGGRLEQETLHFEPETLARLRRIASASSLGEGRARLPPMLPFELRSAVHSKPGAPSMDPFELKSGAQATDSSHTRESARPVGAERPASVPTEPDPSEAERETGAALTPRSGAWLTWGGVAVVFVALAFAAFIWLVSRGTFD